MSTTIRPEWLVRQANELAKRGGPAGRPRIADLRRAVSAAYYAAFHDVALTVAWWLLPGATHGERYTLIRRYQHNSISRVFEHVATPGQASPSLRPVYSKLAANQAVADLADLYVNLRGQRERADYDHLASFTKPEVLQLIDSCEACRASLVAISADHPIDWDRLCACLAMSPGSQR